MSYCPECADLLRENARLTAERERFQSIFNERDDLVAEVRELRQALGKLAREASGFLSMARWADHGQTNINVLKLRIAEADAAIKGTPK